MSEVPLGLFICKNLGAGSTGLLSKSARGGGVWELKAMGSSHRPPRNSGGSQYQPGRDSHNLTIWGPKNNHLAEIWSGSEEGSYLRLIDCCITQL